MTSVIGGLWGLLRVHSITSSARASSECGTVRPSIRAVSALITSSNVVDCTIGKSAGFAPLSLVAVNDRDLADENVGGHPAAVALQSHVPQHGREAVISLVP